jgi:DNA-directed RNA polymerase specialized sigma24 family protein
MRRTGDAELAADLTAETFAAALASRRRFDPAKGPAIGWLYGIARQQRLPADQRAAIEARVVDEQEYEQIAAATQTSEAVIRKRVSRGLASLRRKLEGRTP